jgi:hypothetical protein
LFNLPVPDGGNYLSDWTSPDDDGDRFVDYPYVFYGGQDNLELAGSGVAVRGKSNKYMAHEEDVNGDGRLDLILQVATENLIPGDFQDGYAILTGETFDGELIQGVDEIRIVPPE